MSAVVASHCWSPKPKQLFISNTLVAHTATRTGVSLASCARSVYFPHRCFDSRWYQARRHSGLICWELAQPRAGKRHFHRNVSANQRGFADAALRVHVARDVPESVEKKFLAKLSQRMDFSAGAKHIPPSTQILVQGYGDVSEEQLGVLDELVAFVVPYAGPSLKQQEAVRAENMRRQEAGLPPLLLCNTHHNAPMTAELGVALVLAVSKRLLPADASIRRGDWRVNGAPLPGGPPGFPAETLPMLILEGKQALVIGLGQVGSRIAAALYGLGMDVHAVRRSASRSGEAQPAPRGSVVTVHPMEDLHDLLSRTTVLVLTVPGTQSTRGLIGQKELNKLPEEAVVVNMGRGDVVDEGAIYDAVQSGALFGFASDVWYKYPKSYDEAKSGTTPWLDPAHDFSQLDRVVLSPHRGGARGLPETEQRRWFGLADALNKAVEHGIEKGLPTGVVGVFGLDRGY